jgi:hypothetical protein
VIGTGSGSCPKTAGFGIISDEFSGFTKRHSAVTQAISFYFQTVNIHFLAHSVQASLKPGHML